MAFVAGGSFKDFNKAAMDTYMVNLARNLDGVLNQANWFRNFLNAHADADFTATGGSVPGPNGYSSGDISTIKSAFLTDLGALYDTYSGASVFTPARDLRANLKLVVLIGT